MTKEQMAQYIAILDEVERYRNLSMEEKERIVRCVLEKPYMDLRSDWAFKHVFQDLDLLKMLLEDILPEDILTVEHLEALPNEIDKSRPDDKNIIMDVLVKTQAGEEIIVEMQRKKKKTFKNRMVYYGASKIHGQLKKRDSYAVLKPVYVICFMDYVLDHESDQLVYHYALKERTSGELYGNHLSILLCELPRLNKTSLEGLSPVESWFYILKNMRTFAGKPEDMGMRLSAVAEASMMHSLPDGDKLKYFYDMVTEEEKLDIGEAYYEDGIKKGMQIGEEKGEKIRQKKVALAMLADEMDVFLISKYTGLTVEEIEQLRAK